MSSNRILALALLVVGLLLLFFAYQSSQSLNDQMVKTLTGRFTDSTIWYLILGVASAVVGVGLLFNRARGN